MGETKPVNPKRNIVIIVVAALAILSGVYFAGNFILPNAIKASYQGKNCEQVLSQSSFYASIYPASIADQEINGVMNECVLYVLAVKTESKKTATWQDVYNAYKAYMDDYPKGFFVSDAQERSALALTALAKEQLGTKKYTEALATIETIQQSFGKTNAAKEAASLAPELYLDLAKDLLATRRYADAIETINFVLHGSSGVSASNDATSLMSEVYTAWAEDQRHSGDFADAETTLKTFKTWAEAIQKTDIVKLAQGELAKTYLAWGLDLQNKKQFADAKAEFDQAISTDPDPGSDDGPAVQTKAAQIEMYIAWGDSFIEKNDFSGALDRYQMVVSLSEVKDQPAAKDRISGIYLKWAAKLSGSEDFLGALKTAEQAKKIAVTDGAKKGAETAQVDVYQAFSQSTGEQAQQTIADARDKFCLDKEQPILPIFGTDPQTIRATLQIPPDQGNLTETVRAMTPASLHYVACVTQSTKSEIKTDALLSKQKSLPQWSPAVAPINIKRDTAYWDVKLYKLKTRELVASQLFAGTPKSWDAIWDFIKDGSPAGDLSYPGTSPSLEVVSIWVAKYLK